MRIKCATEKMIDEDAKSIADALGVTVEELKNQKVSLYDIIAAHHDEEAERAFMSCRSVFRSVYFYLIKALLKNG